jgi:hypothetical protein
MASNDYVFVSQWRAPGPVDAVYDLLIDGRGYTRWWSQVYLTVEETDAGGEHGLGKAARLIARGKLPYKPRWQMRVIETTYPTGFTIEATGDFVGRGVWTFALTITSTSSSTGACKQKSRSSAVYHSCSSRSSAQTIAGRWPVGKKG